MDSSGGSVVSLSVGLDAEPTVSRSMRSVSRVGMAGGLVEVRSTHLLTQSSRRIDEARRSARRCI